MRKHATNPINASEVWDNPSLQKAIVKYRQLNDCRNYYKSLLHTAWALAGFIVFSLCFWALGHIVNTPQWSIVFIMTSIFSTALLVLVLISFPSQRSLLSKMEEGLASEKSFNDLIHWFSYASVEDLNLYSTYAPANVYHTFFNHYQLAKQRMPYVNH